MQMFKDKVVILTGASSGIGACTAIKYAKQGAKLVLGGRNEANLKKTGEACEAAGSKPEDVLLVIGDLINELDCNSIVDKAVEKFGKVDVLVNNAGSVVGGNLQESTVKDMEFMYKVLVRSCYITIKRAMPHLLKTKGCVLNISSVAGLLPMPDSLAYGAAKAALNHLTQSVAQDVGPNGVRVNAICPGLIVTEIFTRPSAPLEGASEEVLEGFLKDLGEVHALRRTGRSEEVAASILFLTSEAASFITGALLSVDGGLQGAAAVKPGPERKKPISN